jgi:hypothetical protein
VALLTMAVAAWTWTALLDPTVGHVDPEEGVNAAQAVALAWLPCTDVFRFQYMPVCGGCTVEAVLAAPWFALVGGTTLVWKSVLLVWIVLLAGTTLGAAERRWGGRWTALAALALALPPSLAADLTFRGWGNHHEAAVLALSSLILGWGAPGRRGAALGGAMAVLACFVAWTALPVAIAAAWVGLAPRETRSSWLVGAGLGTVPWLVETILVGGAWADVWTQAAILRRGLGIAGKLRELLVPERLAYVLAGGGGTAARVLPPLVGLALAVSGALASRDRLGRALVLAGAIWVAGYLLGPAELGSLAGEQAFNARYAVPLSWTATLLTVAGARAWAERGRGGLAAAVLVLVLPWNAARAIDRRLHADPGPLLSTAAPDWTWFRRYVLTRSGPGATRLACVPGDALCAEIEAYRRGAAGDAPAGSHSSSHAAGRGAAWVTGLEVVARRELIETPHRVARRADDPARFAEAVAVATPSAHGVASCPRGLPPELEGAFGWGLATASLPRFELRTVEPPCDGDAFVVGWARGLGQVSALRWGPSARPVGYPGWSARARAAFERGIEDVADLPWARWTPEPVSP